MQFKLLLAIQKRHLHFARSLLVKRLLQEEELLKLPPPPPLPVPLEGIVLLMEVGT